MKERHVYSQNGEDGVIEELCEKLGIDKGFFIEIGCGNYTECNTRLLHEKGWNGVGIDMLGTGFVKKYFITKDNILSILEQENIPKEPDIFSFDLDGNDYWILKEILTVYKPKIFVVEYNSLFGDTEEVSVAYDENFSWDGSDYYGASFMAMKNLFKDYTMVYCENQGINMFFVQKKYGMEEGVFKPFGTKHARHRRSPRRPIYVGQ